MFDWLVVFVICVALFYFAFDVIVELLLNVSEVVLVIAAQLAVIFIWITILLVMLAVITSPMWLTVGFVAGIVKFLHWVF